MGVGLDQIPVNENRITPPTPENPNGGVLNDPTGTARVGTPVSQPLIADITGFLSWLLVQNSDTPNGTPDNALESQYGNAITAIAQSVADSVSNAAITAATPAFATAARYITTSGLYVPDERVSSFEVTVIGAGGGGGGMSNDDDGASVSGAGAAGGYSQRHIAHVAGTDYMIIIGSGGAGGRGSSASTGGTGGQSSFTGGGFALVCNGGSGGAGGRANGDSENSVGLNLGGTATGGDINVRGSRSSRGNDRGGEVNGVSNGGNSIFGGSGVSTVSGTAPAASAFGSGGGGGFRRRVDVDVTGGAGGAGIVIIKEFYV